MRTQDKVLCWIYGLIAVGALIATWSQNIRFIQQNDNGGVRGFLEDAWGNPAAASLSNDLMFLALAGVVLMVVEARRLGIRYVWAYVLLSLVTAISVTFPLFLLARQRRLAQLHGRETAGTPAPTREDWRA